MFTFAAIDDNLKPITTMNKKLSLLFFMLLAVCSLGAQNTVTGTVTDESGEVIIGATVDVTGTKIATITDFDGNFSLTVPEGQQTIEVKYVGMKPYSFTVNGSTTHKVVMAENTEKAKGSNKGIGKGTALNTPTSGTAGKILSVKVQNVDKYPSGTVMNLNVIVKYKQTASEQLSCRLFADNDELDEFGEYEEIMTESADYNFGDVMLPGSKEVTTRNFSVRIPLSQKKFHGNSQDRLFLLGYLIDHHNKLLLFEASDIETDLTKLRVMVYKNDPVRMKSHANNGMAQHSNSNQQDNNRQQQASTPSRNNSAAANHNNNSNDNQQMSGLEKVLMGAMLQEMTGGSIGGNSGGGFVGTLVGSCDPTTRNCSYCGGHGTTNSGEMCSACNGHGYFIVE